VLIHSCGGGKGGGGGGGDSTSVECLFSTCTAPPGHALRQETRHVFHQCGVQIIQSLGSRGSRGSQRLLSVASQFEIVSKVSKRVMIFWVQLLKPSAFNPGYIQLTSAVSVDK